MPPVQTAPRLVCLQTVILVALAACGGGSDDGKILTESVRHMEITNALAGPDLEVGAVQYVRTFDDSLDLGLGVDDGYAVASISTSSGIRHARMQQIYLDVPVFSSEMIVHADDTTFLGFNGVVTKNLEGFDVAATVTADQALGTAKDDHAATEPGALNYSREDSTLVILPRAGEGADLAWHVVFENDGPEPGLWSYFVDARSGTIIKKFNGLTTEQASGPGGNAKKARTWSSELDVEPDGAEFKMETDRMVTYDLMNSLTVPAEPVVGPLDPIADAAINDAHGNTEVVLSMMRDWVGRESLDDAGFVIVSHVHKSPDGMSWANASWNGSVMSYGDGGDKYYPLSGGLDVVGHELNHGFTEFHSDLVYAGQSGGLNESFSDVAGTMTEFYDEGDAADFEMGEDVFKDDGALRYMCDPRADRPYYEEMGYPDFGSIDNLSDYVEGIDVHLSSGIANKAFCLAVGRFKAQEGSSTTEAVRRIGHVWYEANGGYWTSGSTFVQACQGTVDAARAIGFSGQVVEQVAQSWADVGVECEGEAFVCNDDGTCQADDGETCASCSEDCGSCAQPCSFWKKAKCKLGIGDCSQCSDESGCGDGLCDGDETDSNCSQDCGCGAPGLNCDLVAPFGCYCDPACNAYGDCCDDYEEVCE